MLRRAQEVLLPIRSPIEPKKRGVMQEAFGIFEGGGGKGLAHVGALSCAMDNGIEFVGIAGASAGAIVASLVACGYKPQELFDPKNDDPSAVYSLNLKTLLGLDGVNAGLWKEFEHLLRDGAALVPKAGKGLIGTWWKLPFFYRRHKRILDVINTQLGVFSTSALESYLNQRLIEGLVKNHAVLAATFGFAAQPVGQPSKKVMFKHVPLPLKIVATDYKRRRLIEFSKELTPDMAVADAVAASVSLPLVFQPKMLAYPAPDGSTTEVHAIDGGLLSNFPAWLFDAERAKRGPHVPTLGFRLVERPRDEANNLSKVSAYLGSVAGVVVNGDPLLETREIENLHEIPLRVSVRTLDFDLDYQQKQALHMEGRTSAFEAFGLPSFPKDREEMKEALAGVLQLFRDTFGVPDDTMLRANIVCKTTRKTLRVTYTYNMDSNEDMDDRLEFPLGSGASGRCWDTRQVIACDLEDAKSKLEQWNMVKYQQAFVRRDLTALLSHPIFDEVEGVIGVLNIDSTNLGILRAVDDVDGTAFFLENSIPQLSGLLLRKPSEA